MLTRLRPWPAGLLHGTLWWIELMITDEHRSTRQLVEGVAYEPAMIRRIFIATRTPAPCPLMSNQKSVGMFTKVREPILIMYPP